MANRDPRRQEQALVDALDAGRCVAFVCTGFDTLLGRLAKNTSGVARLERVARERRSLHVEAASYTYACDGLFRDIERVLARGAQIA